MNRNKAIRELTKGIGVEIDNLFKEDDSTQKGSVTCIKIENLEQAQGMLFEVIKTLDVVEKLKV